MATRGGIGQRILLARVNGENLWFRVLVNVILIIACVAAVYPRCASSPCPCDRAAPPPVHLARDHPR